LWSKTVIPFIGIIHNEAAMLLAGWRGEAKKFGQVA
jgi:hypothetical protein